MTGHFPYPLLSNSQLLAQMNRLAALRAPFLFIVDYKAEQGYVISMEELDTDYIRFQFESMHQRCGRQETDFRELKNKGMNLEWEIQPIEMNDYHTRFDFVQQQIQQGNSFLVNLTQPTKVHTNLTLPELYERSRARYKLWIKDFMLVLSPESFVRIQGRTISSYPMKGTMDASIPNATEIILNDSKEMAEHATIVDLIRNDLSLVADRVKVTRYRYVDRLKTNRQDLLQVSSEITGRLPEDYREHLGDILFKLLPAGSICGAPKARTLEIIRQAEGYERGFYTGVCGYFDGENLDSGVMIRFMEQADEHLIFKSGGGITARSEVKKEYEELIQKVYVPVY